jgi:arginine/lysine/ornithine decarboxylase
VKSNLVDHDKIKYYLQIFQSSSPSYLLIASITECLSLMAKDGKNMMREYLKNLLSLRESLDHLSTVTLLGKEEGCFDYDPGKIVFGIDGYGGKEIAALLREEFHVETEMTAPWHLLAMTSVYDTKEVFFRFQAAVSHLCFRLPLGQEKPFAKVSVARAKKIMIPAAARQKKRQSCDLSLSCGQVAAADLYLYPPGAPLIVAGEKITPEIVHVINVYREKGLSVHGIKNDRLFVISDD